MQFICTLVVVEDIARSRYLYETLLKQKVVADFGENIGFGGFALHKREHFQQLLDGKQIASQTHNFELYFEHDDLETIAKKLEEEQLEFVHPIREQPWKQQVLRFYDYDHNVIEIGERLQHVAYRLHQEGRPLDEIAQITYLPIPAIEAAIREYEDQE